MRGLVAIACAGVLCAACSSAGHPRPQRAEKVAFVSGEDGYVYSADPSGRLPLRRLTKGRDWGAQALTWSPDGRRLTIVQTRESSRVVVMNANGRHRRRLSRVDSELAQLRWTRPGTIDVSVPEDGGRERLFHLGVSNGKISYVREARPGSPSPDGSEHAFVDRKGLRLFVARGKERPVEIRPFRGTGPSPVFLGSPSWSPNGSRLAFVLDRGRGRELWVMGADGSSPRHLVPAPPPNASGWSRTRESLDAVTAGPVWSPDGSSLAYAADLDDDGLDELYVIPVSGGTLRRLAELEDIHDIAWRPAGIRSDSRPPAPRRHPVTRLRTYTLKLGPGRLRLADVRLLRRFASDADRPALLDITRDGSTVALTAQGDVELLDLAHDRVIPLARLPLRRNQWDPLGRFSPDGRKLAYRKGYDLVVRDLASGRELKVGRSPAGFVTWLRGGRIAFLDNRGHVLIGAPAGAARRLAGVPRVARFAITPDGSRVLYDHRCATFLLNTRTRARLRLSGHLYVPFGAWSPNGERFVLGWAEECDHRTGALWTYHSFSVLFSRAGTRIAQVGADPGAWSADSRLLFLYPRETGTESGGLQGLLAVEPLRRRESVLLRYGNGYSDAFAGPGNWVVFTRYDDYRLVPSGVTSGGIYVGRLTRGRRASYPLP